MFRKIGECILASITKSSNFAQCLLYAEEAEQVGLEGPGTVDGQGGQLHKVFPNANDSRRPILARFQDCQGVTLRDVTLVDPASFTTFFVHSRDIDIEGVTIHKLLPSAGWPLRGFRAGT